MNYYIMAKNSLRRNIRKQITFLITCIISSTLLFLYTTLIYNNGTVLISLPLVFGSLIFTASLGNIIMLLSFFTIYSYTSYIKLRSTEFKIMLLIGTTKNELALCLLFENLILMFVCMSIGILLGTIFSKFFFLLVINYLNFSNLGVSLSSINYMSTFEFFIIIYVIITLRTTYLLKDMHTVNNFIIIKPKKIIGKKIKLIIYLFFIITNVCFMIYQTRIGSNSYSIYTWIDCLLMIYGLVFYGNKLTPLAINKGHHFHKNIFLLIKQSATNIEKDKVFIFILACVSFLFINFNLICEYAIFIKHSVMSINELKVLRLITFLTNLLFFTISSSITYFKFQMELVNINKYFKQLYMIGITKEEFDLLIIYRLRSLFFLPCTLCAITSIILVLTMHIQHVNLNEFIIVTSYFFNIYAYKKAVRLYMESFPL
ncbi:FtsX-like permease family protein [Clostridium estertheticum]|uniref:FtsX-like permease family protein n=2 Tax=Clostridium estertheticum TaxID=238834 RepID=A0A5N7ISC9_9CLOT|nr:FtsX-like permease family protein [Clostridium estertheticum]MPQ33229.1 FtsX-like permease family protein [Clostridium estertheticum]MPQ63887.1 FtsX-like permease family protein [Clostridium estertheticum]